MIRITAVMLAVAVPATAQVAPLSFDAGKALPLTQGQWSYFPTVAGSVASFDSALSLRCDRATRMVTITRLGAQPAMLTIATSSLTRALPVGGRLLANDPLLDAIAFSRGRFLVAGGGWPVLAVPSWPEAARSIEDCRS
jgi:hypothetical protein